MPGIEQLSVDALAGEARELAARSGSRPYSSSESRLREDRTGSKSHADDGIVQQAIRAFKEASPELVVVTDVCLCEYTDHGHCGGLDAEGYVLNDETLEVLGRIAVSHAKPGPTSSRPAGCSTGWSGRSGRARRGGARAGRDPLVRRQVRVGVLRPVPRGRRGALRSSATAVAPDGSRRTRARRCGRRRSTSRRARRRSREARAGLPRRRPARARALPRASAAAYNVSGEYAMVKAAAANGWLDERAAVLEALTAIRRGADLIVTYHAKEAALAEGWARKARSTSVAEDVAGGRRRTSRSRAHNRKARRDSLDRRLFMQLHAFGGAARRRRLSVEALARAGVERACSTRT